MKTAWKVSKYGVFLVRIFLYSVRMQENMDQKKLRIWTLLTQWKAILDTNFDKDEFSIIKTAIFYQVKVHQNKL